tara:strand:- start:97 stop:786 length:690 start_codon:yes stop_codon:yes gene_type:complete
VNRIIYLIKTNSNYRLIINFILFSIFSFFKKDKKKQYIGKFRQFLKEKHITQDWFSHNVYDWHEERECLSKRKDYLEIGSFEGISAMYVLENFLQLKVTCVDAWSDKTDGNQDLNIQLVEKNFDLNTEKYKNRIEKLKCLSKDFFKKNTDTFDIIYIDGSHKADDVFYDCTNAWEILRKDGLLILDDYFWNGYPKIEDNTAYGIKNFLKKIKYFRILKLTKYQLFIKKI